MKINAARIKALVVAALAGLAGYFAGHPDVVNSLPAWARAAIGVALSLYAAAGISSTAVKTGEGPQVPAGPVALLLVLALALPACPAGCPQPTPGGTVDHVAHCSSKAVEDHAVDLLPKVNACLVAVDFTGCLLGLVQPAIGVTEEIVACLVGAQTDQYRASAKANPNDDVSVLGARHGAAFLQNRGWTLGE